MSAEDENKKFLEIGQKLIGEAGNYYYYYWHFNFLKLRKVR